MNTPRSYIVTEEDVRRTHQQPGLQYPDGLEENSPLGQAMRNIFDNLFYLRGMTDTQVRQVLTQAQRSMPVPSSERRIYKLSVDTTISRPMCTPAVLECYGTRTHTLLAAKVCRGLSFYFFNMDVGVITISGTVNGNPAGYTLAAQYQYAEIGSDGENWLVWQNN